MRAHRAVHSPFVRNRSVDQPTRVRPTRAERQAAERSSGFEKARARGPVLSPSQQPAVVSFDEALRQVAQELLRLANGLAPGGRASKPASEPANTAASPGAGTSAQATPPGEFGTPPPPPPNEFGPPPSGFSPVAPPGVVDPRVPPPYTITEKRAGTFPAQLPGETLAQYALRTADKTGFNVATLGAFVSMAGSLGAAPNASYAELVDRFQNPTAYWSQAELDRQNMMREADILRASKIYTGPVPVSSLTDDDKRYLAALEQWMPQVGDLFHALLAGSHLDIARTINDTHYNLGTAGFDVRAYHGQLRPLVEKLMAEKGLKHP